jgi:hypothetical protein
MLKKNTGAERFYIMEEKIINGTREDSVVQSMRNYFFRD